MERHIDGDYLLFSFLHIIDKVKFQHLSNDYLLCSSVVLPSNAFTDNVLNWAVLAEIPRACSENQGSVFLQEREVISAPTNLHFFHHLLLIYSQ